MNEMCEKNKTIQLAPSTVQIFITVFIKKEDLKTSKKKE